jgi:hypothetical protein
MMGSEIDNIINNNDSNDDFKSSSSSSSTPTPTPTPMTRPIPIPPASAFTIKTKAKVPPNNNNATFPCIEQPLRVILYCNGYYLWSTRNGTLIARKKRAFEKDEWRLNYHDTSSNSNSGVVMIQNHKFNSTLSVVQRGIKNIAMCIKEEKGKQTSTKDEGFELNDDGDNNRTDDNEINDDFNDEEEGTIIKEDNNSTIPTAPLDVEVEVMEEDQQWCFIKSTNGKAMIKSLKTGENLSITTAGQIVFTSDNDSSYTTNQNSISSMWDIECVTGELCFISNMANNASNANIDDNNSNSGRRIRCDIAGMTSLSTNWKGWEIFRFMECGGGGDDNNNNDSGYVKISSWMHSQWILCSDVYGNVTTCTHSESLLSTLVVEVVHDNDNDNDNDNNNDNDDNDNLDEKKKNNYRCSKWAIEKKNNGLIIRSKTYGRLLFITKDGMLRTTTNSNNNNNTNHDDCDNSNNNIGNNISNSVDVDEEEVNEIVNNSNNNNNNNKPTTIRRMSSSTRSISNSSSNINNWWNSSMKNMQNKFNNNNTTATTATASTTTTTTKSVVQERHEEEQEQEETTILWDLQAAHSQCYYFLSSSSVASSSPSSSQVATNATAAATTKSIGPFPNVTQYLRKSDKIQLLQRQQLRDNDSDNDNKDDDGNDNANGAIIVITKLYLIEKQQYISCSSDGCITATSDSEHDGTDWYMEKGSKSTSTSISLDHDNGNDRNDDDDDDDGGGGGGGGSVFKSIPYNYYLSYKEGDGVKIENATTTTTTGDVEVEGQETTGIMKDDNSDSNTRRRSTIEGRFKNAFNSMKGENLPLPLLIGSKTMMMDDDDDDEQSNNVHMVWNLEPCMPRAVSSEKIKTFAIGTSIAVGTTIAMPFALAGVAAIMGAVGAEAGIGFGIIAVGLSGAEALASVGAIGATAYIVFKPANNSLTDDHKKKKGEEEEEVEEKPWSKRPFSNWRNW